MNARFTCVPKNEKNKQKNHKNFGNRHVSVLTKYMYGKIPKKSNDKPIFFFVGNKLTHTYHHPYYMPTNYLDKIIQKRQHLTTKTQDTQM